MTNFKSLIKFPAGDFATLHYRNIKKEKKRALQKSRGNYESTMLLSVLFDIPILVLLRYHTSVLK